ncbi:helix-turn-helix transcriptional regulator [Vibrio crassostreae]|uniref:helix-turn-helix transcriptional regulator n=1 Tax=Vibrio crassostreae TaxID=246167 RepID=UPI00062ECC64|nr:AlpA family transcriptional regulator [Vibrio crassostreae]CDT26615.1 Putative prophage protein; putative DNA-binding protein (modular protein) [Vibrio crassostreae]
MNPNHSNTEHQNRLMRLKEVMHISGLSRASIYSFMEDGTFPQSVSLGARAIGWRYQDIQNWIQEKIQERNKKLIKQAELKAKQEKRYGR